MKIVHLSAYKPYQYSNESFANRIISKTIKKTKLKVESKFRNRLSDEVIS